MSAGGIEIGWGGGARVVATAQMPRDEILLVGPIEIPMELVRIMHPDPINVGDELKIELRYHVAFSEDEIRGNVVKVKVR